MSTATVVLITLIVYKLTLIGIGLWAKGRNHTETDFLLGGRGLGAVVAGLSYAASTSSAWMLLGVSGFVYTVGLSAIWMVPGFWAGYAVVWLVFGPRLRAESRHHDQLTPTDFLLQDAQGTSRRVAAWTAAILILACFVFYIAAQFDAAGKALAEHFALSLPQAVSLGAFIVLLYSMLGGFWAVSVTDSLQALLMVLVALLVPAATLSAAGGPVAVWQILSTEAPAGFLTLRGEYSGLLLVGFVVGLLGISLGAMGQPQLVNRLMAVRGDPERRRGFLIALAWSVPIYGGMITLGLAGRALLPDLPNSEVLIYDAADRYLPAVLAGVVIAATLSAVMSTVDSILLAAVGAVAHDMGVNDRFPNARLFASRVVMASIAVVAVILTLTLPDSIFNRVLFAWSALGAAFGPIIAFRVADRRVGGLAASVAMLLGFGTTVLFYTLGTLPAGADAGLLVQWATLPGDPFERVVPWIPALAALAVLAPAKAVPLSAANP